MKRAIPTLTLALGLSCALLSGAQAQDLGSALGGLLQNLGKSGNNSNSSNSEGLGKLLNLNGSNNAAPTNNAKSEGQDLVGLLTQSLDQIDEPKEIEIGRNLAAVLLGAKPMHPNMALQRYVNRLGRWISLQSSRPDLPWTFTVLDDNGYNAFAAPGGYIFVTKGLIDSLKDESELAGVLAHEINHVISKHHLKAIRKSAQTGLLTKLVASQLSKNVPAGLSEQLLNIGRDLYSKGLDQSDELEADRNGVALATRAGFDPYGLVAVLTQLRTAAPDNPMFTLQMSTHPPAQVRLDQLEVAMGQRLDQFSGTPPMPLAPRLAKLGNSK
ncbi:M48 family metalloprotease [Rhodoferax sp. GW822-FHT02A01]|uniref:M48 family metalloprotease n=1 Tax=Rhodoferax sp. GW822-FHT02A01 TaxID=3141537 RepID=UPI00315DBED8